VLGARRGSDGEAAGWVREDRFLSRVVAAPRQPLSRRHRRAVRRRERLERRLDRVRERHEAGTSRQSRFSRWRSGRLQRAASRAREAEKRIYVQAKARRDREDPHDLGRYEAAWWPLVRRLGPDVVHALDVSGLAVASRAKRAGARSVYEAHEPKRHVAEDGKNAAGLRQVASYAAHADALIATSSPLADLLVQDLGLKTTPAVVHNAPALDQREPPQPGLRETAGVGGDTPLVVFTGVMTRRRRPGVVLEAMTLLPELEFALLVREDDPWTGRLLERAEELAVADRVHVVPKVPPGSVVSFIAEADLGVLPFARTPGQDLAMPNKLFEYLHAGLPIVVSECKAMADFVRRHGLGEVAPLADHEAWARAIERVLGAPRYRERREEWEALKREWSWERQERELLAVYRGLAAVAGS